MNQLDVAYHIISLTDTNLFLTGKAGTGKTTFLRSLKERLPKRMVVLAPTGIAAINAHGTTIHSFFQFNFGPQLPTSNTQRPKKYAFRKQKIQLIRSLDLIVIDEISMVRADVLDAIDRTLRQYRDRYRPFGGVQMLLIGDMQQLAPVAREDEWQLLKPYYDTPYFFSCHALQQSDFVTVELQHVYRQSNPVFLDILNKVRENTIDENALQLLNSRYIPNFHPDKKEGYIRLCTHNRQADSINQKELAELKTPLMTFEALIEGEFPELSYPTEKQLQLKVGAQVMFVKNDSSANKAYYNGMIGEVVGTLDTNESPIGEEAIIVRCHDTGKEITVGQETWQNVRYDIDSETKEIVEDVIGEFSQYPLKTAWAITVHKSQGLTFEKAIIDVQHSFAHGQTYVALSRCKSLEGLVLSTPVPRSAIINDTMVDQFTHDPRHQEPDEQRLTEMERQYMLRLTEQLFSLQPLRYGFTDMIHFLREYFYKSMPKTYASWNEGSLQLKELEAVSERFKHQYTRLIISGEDNVLLQERIKKGAEYFEEQLIFVHQLLKALMINTDNQQLRKQRDNILENFKDTYKLKCQLLHYVRNNGLHMKEYLKEKARITLTIEDPDSSKSKKKSPKDWAKEYSRRAKNKH